MKPIRTFAVATGTAVLVAGTLAAAVEPRPSAQPLAAASPRGAAESVDGLGPDGRLSPVPSVPTLNDPWRLHLLKSGAALPPEGQGATAAFRESSASEQPVRKDVPYVPTADSTVQEMLRLAGVGPKDVVYDLGSGDGRIVITAAQKYGARGVGVDIDPQRIKESRENAKMAGVEDRVRFVQGDLFEADIADATVVTLYLLPDVNRRLMPKLLAELKPGTRVVSHAFDMGEDWKPEKVSTAAEGTVYLWRVPKR